MLNQRFLIYFYCFIFGLSIFVFALTLSSSFYSVTNASETRSENTVAKSTKQQPIGLAKESEQKFEFLKKDIEMLRQKLISKEELVESLRESLSESEFDRERLRKSMKEAGAVDEDKGKEISAAPISIETPDTNNLELGLLEIITIVKDEDMSSLRNFIGSLHKYRSRNYDADTLHISVFAHNLTRKYQEEIRFWFNVDFFDIDDFLRLGSDIGLFEHDFKHVLLPNLVNEVLLRHQRSIYIDSSLSFKEKNSTQILNDMLSEKGALFLADQESVKVFGVIANTPAYNDTIYFPLKCQRKMGPCHESSDLSKYSLAADAIFQNQGKDSIDSCFINIRNDLMYSSFIESTPETQISFPNKTIIGMGVPTTGHKLSNALDSRLLNIFLPNFLASITTVECENFHFVIYVGYDGDDIIWDNSESFSLLQTEISKQIAPYLCVSIKYVRIPFTHAWLTFIWNKLYAESISDGCEFYFQVNDDLEIVDSGWATNYTLALSSNEGYGVAGPYDPKWNCTVLTQAMVSTKHYERYGYFYPFEDWYSDFWITRIYSPHNLFCSSDFKAKNIRDQGTRYDLCNRPKWTEAVNRDKFIRKP